MRHGVLYVCGTLLLTSMALTSRTSQSGAEYRIFAGNTHSHTAYTWSHGDHLATNGCSGILTYTTDSSTGVSRWSDGLVRTGASGCTAVYVINGSQIPAPGVAVKPNWQTFQGPPSAHYAAAKAASYDFYAATDHSQDEGFQPPTVDNPVWLQSKKQAVAATDSQFVAIAGFEYSENDGPGGTGHLNVYNSAGILNALNPGIDLPYFYKWLAKAKSNANGPVVASFNHPDADQYNNWGYRDPRVTDIVTMLEVVNSTNGPPTIHYQGFVNALDHGWKVSPISGNDNHGLGGINSQNSRTFVLARDKTKASILDAMRNRRTYASLDRNLQARYTVNGSVMGSTLNQPAQYRFDIAIADPDTGSTRDKITKVDIVKDGGMVVLTYSPTPGYSVRWTPTVDDSAAKYFFVRVWTSGGGDTPGADPANPVAWLAPVWIGR